MTAAGKTEIVELQADPRNRLIRAIDCLRDRFSACNATIHTGSFPPSLPRRQRIAARQSIVLREKERKKADARIRTPRNDGCQCKLLEIGHGGNKGRNSPCHAAIDSDVAEGGPGMAHGGASWAREARLRYTPSVEDSPFAA